MSEHLAKRAESRAQKRECPCSCAGEEGEVIKVATGDGVKHIPVQRGDVGVMGCFCGHAVVPSLM